MYLKADNRLRVDRTFTSPKDLEFTLGNVLSTPFTGCRFICCVFIACTGRVVLDNCHFDTCHGVHSSFYKAAAELVFRGTNRMPAATLKMFPKKYHKQLAPGLVK